MNRVISAKQLSKDMRAVMGSTLAEPPPSETTTHMPVAIVAVHGISPVQRYAFQDQFAIGLRSYLNTIHMAEGTSSEWVSTAYWPKVEKDGADPVLRPSALRLHRKNEDPHAPTSRVFDIYEGYWSPYSKGKTTIFSALTWLLSCTFLGTSSTARVPASGKKLLWDFGYVFGVLALALLSLVTALTFGIVFWGQYVGLWGNEPPVPWRNALSDPIKTAGSFWDFLVNPTKAGLPSAAYGQLLADLVIAFFIVQLIAMFIVGWKTSSRTALLHKSIANTGTQDSAAEHNNDAVKRKSYYEQSTIDAQTFRRWTALAFIASALILALADALVLRTLYPDHWQLMLTNGWGLLVAAIFFRFTFWLGNFIVDDVLGDIQVYTTHDENSEFYAIRQSIISAVKTALLGPLLAVNKDSTPLYERIHVAGHSLGSTIGLDVMILLRQLVEEGVVKPAAWERIRSFITFGTALEKTRFLFDVRKPTVSTAQAQWENDVYGRFFTDDADTLDNSDNREGVYWLNLWYFRDIVANALVSYESVVPPGSDARFTWKNMTTSRVICANHELPHTGNPFAFIHGDYLADPLFWSDVGHVFTK